MRQNAAPVARLGLVAGLLLAVAIAGLARVADGAEKPWLGVYTQEMSEGLREGLDYDGPGGVLVTRVVGGSPAEKAGLRRDDVLVRLNGRQVDNPAELTEIVGAARVGQRVSVQVSRGGASRTLSVTLGARPEGAVERRIEIEVPDAPEPPEAPEAPEAPAAPKEREKRIVIRDLEDLEDLDEAPGLGFMGDGPGVLRLAGRGRLGARVESLSPALGEYFGLKDGKGALVLEVLEGRSAAKAGLLAGDVITRVDDKPVADSRDLVGALRGKDGKVALRVVRHGSPRTIEAVLDEPGSAWTMSLGDRPGGSPGVRKQIVLRATDRDDLRHELDRLKRDLEKLRERLELELEEERGE